MVDKADDPKNWIETSCSALFIYTIARAVKSGVLDESYKEFAIKGYRALVKRMKFDENGLFIMPEICIGTGVGTTHTTWNGRSLKMIFMASDLSCFAVLKCRISFQSYRME